VDSVEANKVKNSSSKAKDVAGKLGVWNRIAIGLIAIPLIKYRVFLEVIKYRVPHGSTPCTILLSIV
jgi:hypothetical protein